MTYKSNVFFLFFCGFCAELHAQNPTFIEAINQGSLSGEIRNVVALGSHTDAGRVTGPINNSRVGSSALAVNYKTAPIKGASLHFGVQAGQDWELNDRSAGLASEDDNRNSITSTSVQQAYLNYQFNQSSIRIGRQDIISPLVTRGSAFPLRDAFDAIVVSSNSLPQTNLTFMYIDAWIKRYGDDSNGSVIESDDHFDQPVYSLYVNNKSIKGLEIEGQWLANNSDESIGDPPTVIGAVGPYDATFLALNYALPHSTLTLGAKYSSANFEQSSNTDAWGLTASIDVHKINLAAGYTSVNENNNLPGTLGHVPLNRAYAYSITDAEFIAGVDATSFGVGYNFGLPYLSLKAVYTHWQQSINGIQNSGIDLDGAAELAVDIKYKFRTENGLSARVQLSQIDYDIAGDTNLTYGRVSINYAF